MNDACTFGSAVPDQVSDLALVRGSDDGSVHSPNSLKFAGPSACQITDNTSYQLINSLPINSSSHPIVL